MNINKNLRLVNIIWLVFLWLVNVQLNEATKKHHHHQTITSFFAKNKTLSDSVNPGEFYFDIDHDFDSFVNFRPAPVSMFTNNTIEKRTNIIHGGKEYIGSVFPRSPQSGGSSSPDEHTGGSSNPNANPPSSSTSSDDASKGSSTSSSTASDSSSSSPSTSDFSSSSSSDSSQSGSSTSSSNDDSGSSSSSSSTGTGSSTENTNSEESKEETFKTSSASDEELAGNEDSVNSEEAGDELPEDDELGDESEEDGSEEDVEEEGDEDSEDYEDDAEETGDEADAGEDSSDLEDEANIEYYNNAASSDDGDEIKDLNEEDAEDKDDLDEESDSESKSQAPFIQSNSSSQSLPSFQSPTMQGIGRQTQFANTSSQGQVPSENVAQHSSPEDSTGSLDEAEGMESEDGLSEDELSSEEDGLGEEEEDSEEAMDDEEEEDEDESFGEEGNDEPEETGDEDFDSSEDGEDADLEDAEDDENEEDEGEGLDEDDADGSYEYDDLDNDVLQEEENEDEGNEDEEDLESLEAGEEEDAMSDGDADVRSNPDSTQKQQGDVTAGATDANTNEAATETTETNAADDGAGVQQGFSAMKKFGRKMKRKGLRKLKRIGLRKKIRFGGRRKIRFGGRRKIRFGGRRKIRFGGRMHGKLKTKMRMKKLGGKVKRLKWKRLRKIRLPMRKMKMKLRFRGGKHKNHPWHKMGSKMIKMGGKLIRLPGKKRRRKIRIRIKFKISLIGRWDWRRYVRGFKYESIGKANVGVLIDGTIAKHLGIVQRWIYNLVLLFKRGSWLSFGTFGGGVQLHSDFKTFGSAAEIKGLMQGVKAKAGGRKIGEALEFYYPLFKAVKGKSGLKSVLFLFTTGVTTGDGKKMIEYGVKYRKLGVVIFVFGLGPRAGVSSFRSITRSLRVFSMRNYKAVILGGMGLKLGHRAGMRRSIFVILQSRLGKWLGMKVGISSKHAAHHHGHSHKEWWFSMWNWYRYIGLRYGSIGRANIAFVVDSTNAELMMFLQRFVYNIARLFQSQGTYISIIAYGRKAHLVTKWQTFTSAQDLQAQCSAIPFIQSRHRHTSIAMIRMLKLYRPWLVRANAPKIPSLLFLMATGPSSSRRDKNSFISIARLFRKAKIDVFTMGIGPEGKKASIQLRFLAKGPRFSFAGDVSGLVQKASFNMFSGGLLKLVGAGNAMQYTVGSKMMGRVQMKWNWRVGMKSIRYGYLGRANIGILVDGVGVPNFGYLRRFIYNIIRMYSLSGTYVNLMVYGTRQYRVANFVQLRNTKQIKRLVMKMPKVANGKRRTGAALQAMLNCFGDAPPGNPNVLYVILHGKSTDSVNAPAALLRKYGIKAFPFGVGSAVSGKELASIAFSSSTIFKSGINGMVHSLNNIQTSAATISGTVSKACGKKGHTRCGRKAIIKQWQWKTFGVSFRYGIVSKASIIFLVDGNNKNHFDVMQKLAYNIYKFFSIGTSVSVITYGGSINKKLAKLKTFSDGTAFQAFISAMDYRGVGGRNTGQALAAALTVMKGAPGKKICFLFSTGKSTDDVAAPAKAMVKSGVSIFALGIGKGAVRAEMKTISRYYLVIKWRGLLEAMVKIQNSLKKVIGAAPQTEPEVGPLPDPPKGDPPKKPPLPVPTAGFLASSATQSMGLLQTKWDWFKFLKLKTGGLKMANVVIILDVSKNDNVDIIQRFVANLFFLFDMKTCSFTLMLASDVPTTSFSMKVFGTTQEIIDAVKKIKVKPSRKLKSGKALYMFKKNVLPIIEKDDQKTPVLFFVTRTKSSDDISKVGEQIKGSGCKTVSIGIGNDFSQEELGLIGLNGQLGLSGSVTSLPALIGRILFGLTTVVNGPPAGPTMTLSGMAGNNGAALSGAVMNTVQTGSVPSETAGQSGAPNTGSAAGDAQGDETAGTAGAPENGGATKPDGTQSPADSPKLPPAPGPKEVGGGATGAGGSDVATGVAGATEAVAGQSKVDGGPGGPGDGKVTSGSSNQPVNTDGTPAKLPVKPDGSPVEPTNPDGSPGSGPPLPDGTPANPDVSSPPGVNSDGTPAAETSDPKKPAPDPAAVPANDPAAPAVPAAPPAAGGCGCPTCPGGCLPVICSQPAQKDCVGRDFILKKFHKDINTEDEGDLNSIKKLLEDYFKEEGIANIEAKKKTQIPKAVTKINSQMNNMKH
ncbi:uncharacterized protein [Clytia hemisphaerica]|uniref:VWFA domain-containing protein n=1 Tax=Clytia hemisphaerica TaxID=252671 RepID=A0A7M5WTI0_9CNID